MQLHREGKPGLDQKAVAAAIVVLRTADAVIAGPFCRRATAPGMVVHVADLARWRIAPCLHLGGLLVHPGFGQIAPGSSSSR